MTTLKERITKKILIKTAAKEMQTEIEQAGLDTLKELADLGSSIVGVYLKSRSPQQKAKLRQDLNTLLQKGVTADMLLEEVAKQMPQLATIMERKQDYKRSEIKALEAFLKG